MVSQGDQRTDEEVDAERDARVLRGQQSVIYKRLVGGEWAAPSPGELDTPEITDWVQEEYRRMGLMGKALHEFIAVCGSYLLERREPKTLVERRRR
jgi:hypothetical protein